LGRNNAKTLLFLDFLEEYGIRVVTLDGKYDSLKDNDTVGIETWFNERYVRDISRKIRANLRHKIEKGEYIGRAPYGYKKTAEGKNKLFADPDTAPVVKEIFRLYSLGYGYSHIAGHLNSMGIAAPSSRGCTYRSSVWSPVTVQRIICNRVYTGDTVQGVSERISFKSKKVRRLPGDMWVITENTHEAIISKSEFDRIQKIREGKKTETGTHKGILHLFKGLIKCGRCGSTMYARVRKGRPAGYICGSYGKNGCNACTSHYVNEKFLINIILSELDQLLNNEHVVQSLKGLIENFLQKLNGGISGVDRLKQQLAAKMRQQELLYMDRLEDRVSDQFFTRMNAVLENKITALGKEIKTIEERIPEAPDTDLVLTKLKSIIQTGKISREIIKAAVEKIIIYDINDEFPDANHRISCNCNDLPSNENGVIVVEFKYMLS